MWHRIKRFQQHLKTETNPDIRRDMRAIIAGMVNFHTYSRKWEKTARERYENYCRPCAFLIAEPVPSEAVTDVAVPEISKKICGHCGCTAPYKLRQSIKPCEFWK